MTYRLMTIFTLIAITVAATLQSEAQERWVTPPYVTFGTISEPDATAISGLIETYRVSWGEQDVDTLITLHAEDTEWTNAFARTFRSSDSLGDFMRNRMFPNFSEEVSQNEAASFRPVSTRYLGTDAAVVHFVAESMRNGHRNDPNAARQVHFHLVLEKQDCDWKIVSTAIFDARR